MTALSLLVSTVLMISPERCERGSDGVLSCQVPGEAVPTGEYRSDGWTKSPVYPELYCGTSPMSLAREPSVGWATFTAADVVDSGDGHPGAFRSSLTSLPSGGFSMIGYWTYDWATETLRVASVSNGVVRLADTHVFGLGKADWTSKKRRYCAVNAREFLDSPGEWYLDRTAKRLHFLPPAGNPGGPYRFVYGQNALLFLDHRTNEVVRGRSFAFGGGNGVELHACENILIADCTIECVSGRGLVIGDDCRNVTVSNCTIRTIGRGGVLLQGGDRPALAAGGNRIVNCEICDFGRLQRVYTPAVWIYGCGNAVVGCHIHHAPHSAIIYGGNEHLIADNHIHDVVLETDDAGAIYSGRDWTSQGNVLRGNYIHDLGRIAPDGKSRGVFTMCVYLDDCDCGDTIVSNRFERSDCAVTIGGGRENIVRDNVIVDCAKGIHLDSRGVTWTKDWCNTNDASWNLVGKAEALGYRKDPWRTRYPRLARILSDEPRLPKYNVISGNAMSGCPLKYDFDTFPAIEAHLKEFFVEKTSLLHGSNRSTEDSAILNGLALSLFVDRHDREWSAKLARGLLNLATAHGVPGFVARGLDPETGRLVNLSSSRDQLTHFVHGLYRYYMSGLADETMKKEIRAAFAAVADRMLANVTPENDWNALTADGRIDSKGLLRMWKVKPHEAARLPMVYAAAWKTTGDEKYRAAYLKYADAALAESMKVAELPEDERRRTMPGYAFVQMNASLEVIRMADTERASRTEAVMKEVARLAARRFVAERGSDGPWLSAAGDLACAVASVSKIEDLGKLLGDELNSEFRRLFSDCLYGVDGQPPLWESSPARIVSVLGAHCRLP